MDLKRHIRTIPDYPRPGIMFRDITTLLGDASALRATIDGLVAACAGRRFDRVAGIEARGFILGGALADRLSLSFVPLRKKGKLPHRTLMASYQLEYGVDELHMHEDAVAPGEHVLLIDDLIATGGTACAGVELLRRGGGVVDTACFVIDLPDLGGADRLRGLGVQATSLVAFEGH